MIKRFKWADRFSKDVLDFYKENNFVVFKDLLPTNDLMRFQKILKKYKFVKFKHTNDPDENIDSRIDDFKGFLLPSFLFSSDQYVEFANKLTRSKIKCFRGRIYRLTKRNEHLWHTDCGFDRKIGLSINLKNSNYLGGEFKIRYAGRQRQVRLKMNEAVFFKIHKDIEHRSADIKGNSNKFHIAGWYVTK
jgi:hypothetical protein